MPLYSASKIIGSTLTMNEPTNYYSVFDINSLGDKAKPIGQLKKGASIVVDSFLEPTSGYTNYGIKYAARNGYYLTFYSSNSYYAVRIEDIGKQSNNLNEQGIKTVKQEIEEKQRSENSFLTNLLLDLRKNLMPILIIILLIVIALKVIPLLKTQKQ